jgi:hypothetical protein
MARERDILNPLLKAATLKGARLFRQNVGTGWVGRILRQEPGLITLANPRALHAGLCKGSSDVIGWTPVLVTQDMVGKQVAVMTAVEIKTKGVTVTPEQARFVQAVCGMGGFGMVVRSVEDFERGISEAVRKMQAGEGTG